MWWKWSSTSSHIDLCHENLYVNDIVAKLVHKEKVKARFCINGNLGLNAYDGSCP